MDKKVKKIKIVTSIVQEPNANDEQAQDNDQEVDINDNHVLENRVSETSSSNKNNNNKSDLYTSVSNKKPSSWADFAKQANQNVTSPTQKN